jgi:hypothetical protein
MAQSVTKRLKKGRTRSTFQSALKDLSMYVTLHHSEESSLALSANLGLWHAASFQNQANTSSSQDSFVHK